MTQNRNHKLFTIIRLGNISALEHFLAKEYHDNSWKREIHAKSGDSVLHVATRHGHLELVKWLILEQALDPDIANHDGKQPLHDAAQFSQPECLKFLIHQNICVDCLKRADWTPLMLACTKPDLAVVKQLVDAGANISLKNKDGWNSFHIACREGDLSIAQYLLDKDKHLAQVSSKNGRTPLHTAALHGHTSLVVLLCDVGQTVDVTDSCGSTPLMDALRSGHTQTADTLLRYKASLYCEDNVGRTCLHASAQSGAVNSVHWLCERGISLNLQSSMSGITALHMAAKEGQSKMCEELCQLGAEVNMTDHKGRTALHQACGGSFVECVKILHQNGAVDTADHSGRTAASFSSTPEIQRLLKS